MIVRVAGRNMDIGESFRTHIENSMKTMVDKLFKKAVDCGITVHKEAYFYKTEISINLGDSHIIHAEAESKEPYPSFDAAAHKLETQLHKVKDKQNHH